MNNEPAFAESPTWAIRGYKFRHTIRYNTKLCVRIEACSISTAIREHKENIHVVLEVWGIPVFPLYANKLFWFSDVFTIVSETVLAITFYHSKNRF